MAHDTDRQPRMELLLDDHRGIYIPQGFAEEWSHLFTYRWNPGGYEQDIEVLRRGPRAREAYDGEQHEVWARVLSEAVGVDILPHGGPVPPRPNPWAGWVLDQGSAEDGCVRAYHPDDADLVFGGG